MQLTQTELAQKAGFSLSTYRRFEQNIGNRDDHAKNFSFVYDNGWSFSPAYDLLPCGSVGDYHTTSFFLSLNKVYKEKKEPKRT